MKLKKRDIAERWKRAIGCRALLFKSSCSTGYAPDVVSCI